MLCCYPCSIMQALTILLAEDEPVISLDIRYLLEEIGLRVIQVTDLQAITEACEQFRPCLAILNYKQQENGDGMSIARMLKQRFSLPVMLISGVRPKDILASGTFDSSLEILYKPFTRTQLRQFVNRWLA